MSVYFAETPFLSMHNAGVKRQNDNDLDHPKSKRVVWRPKRYWSSSEEEESPRKKISSQQAQMNNPQKQNDHHVLETQIKHNGMTKEHAAKNTNIKEQPLEN